VREHNEAVNQLDVILPREPITAAYVPGEVEQVTQHDGSVLRLRKLATEYDVHDRLAAMRYLQDRRAAGEIVTGVLHVDADPEDLHAHLGTAASPFNGLGEKDLCPGSATLEAFNAAHR
jgi:2-oxoglutarate ferredoxin oxidoreductase subunit beta